MYKALGQKFGTQVKQNKTISSLISSWSIDSNEMTALVNCPNITTEIIGNDKKSSVVKIQNRWGCLLYTRSRTQPWHYKLQM